MRFTTRFFCLLLAVAMIFSIAGCKKSDTSSELSEEIEYIYQYEDEPASGEQDASGSQQGGSGAGQSQQTSSGEKPSTPQSVKDAYEKKAQKYRGTKVVFATWESIETNEHGPAIREFEKKYGIELEVDTIGEANYIQTVVSRIASNQAPDIFFCTSAFPSGVECLQPIDAAELDMSDPIWEKTILEKSKIGGKSYLVNTIGCMDNSMSLVFYNKALFRDNNITTPEEYQKAGNWNLDTFEKAMRDVTAISEDYVGAFIDTNAFLPSMGCEFWKVENGTFKNGVDSKFIDVCRRYSQWIKDGLTSTAYSQVDKSSFVSGNAGMAFCDDWGLKKSGYWRDMNWEDIGWVTIPDYDKNTKAVPNGIWRGWGICKGAKNPVGAGIFLRYYLDVNNYDTSQAFISSEAESAYFKLTSSKNIENKLYYFTARNGTANCTTVSGIAKAIDGDPSQVKSSIEALKNTIEYDVKDINSFIAKYK